MNPVFKQAQEQLSELAAMFVGNPEMQDAYVKVLELEGTVQILNIDLEQIARNLADALGKKQQYNADAAYYRVLMTNITSDPILMEQWTDMLMTMKLTNPDIEADLKEAAKQAQWV